VSPPLKKLPEYKTSIRYRKIRVTDISAKSSLVLKLAVCQALRRHPKALPYISKVYFYRDLFSGRMRISGQYLHKTQIIKLSLHNSLNYEIIETAHHEIGHALEWALSDKEVGIWGNLYYKHLHRLGLEFPLWDKWEKFDGINALNEFPSYYCLHSRMEYFAESISEASTDIKNYKKKFHPEYKLLKEMRILPLPPKKWTKRQIKFFRFSTRQNKLK